MLKDNNLVRVLAACETMGNATTVCSDKTGTLTQNRMAVVAGAFGSSFCFEKSPKEEEEGVVAIANVPSHVSKSALDLINQSIAVNSTAFEGENEKGEPCFVGNKTETALLQFSRDLHAEHYGASGVSEDSNDDQVPYEDLVHDKNLTFIGVVGIEDPLREGVPEAVQACQRAGVFVRMVTGDNLVTAKSIAKQCGIYTPGGIVMEGPAFRKLPLAEMDAILPRLQVLARSSPEDKRILVSRLRELGDIVAVTGDGTNDGPALKMADVGFSMGIAGTEVAKEASSIILMDDNFSSIVKAIMWGRCVNDAVKKFLQFQLTTVVFNTFVFCQIFNKINCRRIDNKLNIFTNILANKFFIVIFFICVLGQVVIVQFGGPAFQVVALDGIHWAIAIVVGLLSIPIGVVIRLIPDHLFGFLFRDPVTREKHIGGNQVTTPSVYVAGNERLQWGEQQ
ncbi:Putative Calcium-translocating P-type ATPase, PMCA-type [Rhizopus microsporus]|nr:Putative Calcium-translocating P-type ATPase, PMCA-type [Rhizopus microsporus]